MCVKRKKGPGVSYNNLGNFGVCGGGRNSWAELRDVIVTGFGTFEVSSWLTNKIVAQSTYFVVITVYV